MTYTGAYAPGSGTLIGTAPASISCAEGGLLPVGCSGPDHRVATFTLYSAATGFPTVKLTGEVLNGPPPIFTLLLRFPNDSADNEFSWTGRLKRP